MEGVGQKTFLVAAAFNCGGCWVGTSETIDENYKTYIK